MRRFWAAWAASAWLTLGGASWAHAAPVAEGLPPAIRQAIDEGRCDLATLKRIATANNLKDFDSGARAWVYLALSHCEEGNGPQWLKLATSEPGALAIHWRSRLADDINRRDRADAMFSMAALAKRVGADAPLDIGDDLLFEAWGLVRDDRDDSKAFLMLLDAADWRAVSPFRSGDFLWCELVAILLDAGDTPNATRVAARIHEPELLLQMALDKRYDPLIAANPGRFDLRNAAERKLEADSKALAAWPTDGDGLCAVARDLRQLGRPGEALALLEAALANPGSLAGRAGHDQRNWVVDGKALTLKDLARHDEALDVMRAAANFSERGGRNVSQIINLAGYLNNLSRNDDAISELTAFDKGLKASPFGDTWVAAERACGYLGLRRPQEAAKAMDFTKAHAKDAPAARLRAMLCAEDLDGVAAFYIAWLADPGFRAYALVDLSRVAHGPGMTGLEVEVERRMDVVRARPDVTAAVSAVGRTVTVPLYASGFQSYRVN